MAWTERTVACPECKTERTTKAGKGTVLACSSCGVKFPAPAPEPATEPVTPAPAKAGPRVKRAKASATVARQRARPRKDSPTAGDGGKPPAEPAEPASPPTAKPDPAGAGDPPAGPAAKPDPTDEPGRRRQRAAGRRGGLAYYARHLKKAS